MWLCTTLSALPFQSSRSSHACSHGRVAAGKPPWLLWEQEMPFILLSPTSGWVAREPAAFPPSRTLEGQQRENGRLWDAEGPIDPCSTMYYHTDVTKCIAKYSPTKKILFESAKKCSIFHIFAGLSTALTSVCYFFVVLQKHIWHYRYNACLQSKRLSVAAISKVPADSMVVQSPMQNNL